MGLENSHVIDLIGSNDHSIILVLVDVDDWTDEHDHLLLLEDKINAYIGYVVDGQVYEGRRRAADQEIMIQIVFTHDLPDSCVDFLRKVKPIVEKYSIKFEYRIDL